MPKISERSIERLRPIAEAIDMELTKPEPERVSLYIRTAKPKTMKNELNNFKSQFKANDWRGKFWLIVHNSNPFYGPCVEVSFNASRSLANSYEIVRPEEKQTEIYRGDELARPESFLVTPTSELQDETQIGIFILTENPINMKIRFEVLSTDTQNYLTDPQNNEETPLIRSIIRRGYHFTKRDSFLWITKDGSNI